MSTIIIHLSDLHLETNSAAFADRARKIVESALSPIREYKNIHLVVSGDLANKGNVTDYDVVSNFIQNLKSECIARVGITPSVIVCPGNHDCDFSEDQSVRDILIQNVRSDFGKTSPAVIKQISSVMKNFRSFQKVVMPTLKRVDEWSSTFTPDDQSGLNYILLNTSLLSTIKEDVGKLFFPIDLVEALQDARTVVVMHHPLGWFNPDNAREIAQKFPALGDLVFMGHEHVAVGQHVKNIYDGSSVYYLKGHVLRDPSDANNSAFQTIVVDETKGFMPVSYRWNDDSFRTWDAFSNTDFISWPSEVGAGRLAFSLDALKVLRNPGANFSHRRKPNVTLEDIFVWPNLKNAMSEKETANPALESYLSSSKCLSEANGDGAPMYVIKGGEQSGKSALARMIALQLSKRGLAPLYLAASAVSSWRDGNLSQRITSLIDDTYGKKSRDEFLRLDPSRRVLIIDDFDLAQVASGYFDALRTLRQQFGRIYLFLDSHPGMEIVLNEFLRDECFYDAEVFDLVQSTQAHRLDIIERWVEIGIQDSVDTESLKLMAARLLKIVDETLGRNLIPSLPIFVLIVLQRAEIEQDLDTVVKSGSHGFLYESMIRHALTIKVTAAGLVANINYLTAYAGYCDANGVDGLYLDAFKAFHAEHCNKYHLDIHVDKLLRELVEADILDYNIDFIRFRYPFHFYYFFARWLSNNQNWDELEPRINQMVVDIHTERNANVLLFIAHLGKNNLINQKILVSAKAMFAHYPDGADIFEAMPLIDFKPQNARLVMIEGRRHEQLEDRKADEANDEQASKDITLAAQERLKDRLHDALQMNAAFKTLQVLGQILRNHAGEIEREEKIDMTETCVMLGLRVLRFIYDTVETHSDELVLFRAEQMLAAWRADNERKDNIVGNTHKRKKDPNYSPPEPSDAELSEQLARYIPSLVASVTVGTILKIANAIGCEDLTPTINTVLDSSSTRRLVRLGTKLEHFSEFPMGEVLEFEKEYLNSSDVLPELVLRRFLIRRFQLFPLRDELKRQVLNRFKISPEPFKFLTQRAPRGKT